MQIFYSIVEFLVLPETLFLMTTTCCLIIIIALPILRNKTVEAKKLSLPKPSREELTILIKQFGVVGSSQPIELEPQEIFVLTPKKIGITD